MCNSAKKIQNESCKRRRALLRAVGTWLAMSDGEPPRWHPGSLASITCLFPFLSTCAIRSVSYPPQKSDLATLKPCPASGRPNFHSTPRVCVCVRACVCACALTCRKKTKALLTYPSHTLAHTHTHTDTHAPATPSPAAGGIHIGRCRHQCTKDEGAYREGGTRRED